DSTIEKSYENAVGQTVSISCVSARMKLGDEIKSGWKVGEKTVVRDELAISVVAFWERKFRSDALFNITDDARAMRVFAHDAIPPVEGTAWLSRERDRVSDGFD